jgi:hypothetical protein
MLMHVGVTFAFLGACRASVAADLKQALDEFLVGARPARANRRSRSTNVRAIQVKPDALPQVHHVRFAKARVGTDAADLCAIKTLFNASNETVVCVSSHVGVRADHFLDVHLDLRARLGVR